MKPSTVSDLYFKLPPSQRERSVTYYGRFVMFTLCGVRHRFGSDNEAIEYLKGWFV